MLEYTAPRPPPKVAALLDSAVAPSLRPYRPGDRAACLAVFDTNTPRFFAPAEREDFRGFLEAGPDDYFVLEDSPEDGPEVVGCGGVFVRGGEGGLCWGMVARDRHRQGLGSVLLRKRLALLAEHRPEVEAVVLDTTQHSRGFFARFGFEVVKVTPDGYAPGLDRYDMRLGHPDLLRLGREDVEPGRRKGV